MLFGREANFENKGDTMHYERAASLSGEYRGDVGQESEEEIGKSAEE